MSRQARRAPTGELFTMHPSHDPYSSIWREPGSEGERLHHHFADAARRLASTFPGDPSHEILLPWLYLNRHAIELALKYVIAQAMHLRLVKGHREPSLDHEDVTAYLRSTHSHSIASLIKELDGHLAALGHASLAGRAAAVLTAIDSTDPSGEAFRYSGALPHDDVAMDFPGLNESVTYAFDIVDAVDTMLDEDMNAYRDKLEHDAENY